MSNIPQLAFSNNRWILYLSVEELGDTPTTLELRINYGFHGKTYHKDHEVKDWNSYRMYVHQEGDEFEVVTDEEWKERVEAITQNEPEEVVDIWIKENTVRSPDQGYGIWRYLQIFDEMIAKWEAMQTLGLFRPSITY